MDSPSEEARAEKLQCSLCSSSFKRPEHLKRHERTHEAGKRFTCTFCSKSFARSDILARHSSIHTHPARLAEPPPAQKGQRRRACTECAKSREKCTKGQPCLRCSLRSLICTYPSLQRRKRRTTSRHPERSGSVSSEDDDQEAEDSLIPAESGPDFAVGDAARHNELEPQVATSPLGHMDAAAAASHQNGVGSSFAGLSLDVVREVGPPTAASNVPSYDASRSFNPNPEADLFAANNLQGQGTPYPMFSMPLDTPSNQGIGLEGTGFSGFGYHPEIYDPSLGFPINWLPANDEIDIDYTSILGLGISSSGLFPDETANYPSILPAFHGSDSLSPHSAGSDLRMDIERVSHPGSNTAHTPGNSVSTTSHNSQGLASRRAGPGGLYATSTNGARVPCTVRSKRPAATIIGARPIHTVSSDTSLKNRTTECNIQYGFRDLFYLSPSPIELEYSKHLNQQTYERLTHHFDRICLKHDSIYPPFSTPNFPLKHHLDLFIHLFLEYFNPIFPIIHNQLSDFNHSWQLALAMAAIGCQYTQTQEFTEYIPPIHEFLRRVMAIEYENRNPWKPDLAVIQAYVLSQVALSYYGLPEHTTIARSRHSLMTGLVQSYDLLAPTPVESIRVQNGDHQNGAQQHEPIELQWRSWVEGETKRRLGYAIWLLDCMAVYHFEAKPLLSLEIAMADLPQDVLWDAPGCSEWSDLANKYERNPSLATAVQNIFVDKSLNSDLGEFGRVLTLHGVYSEIFQVKCYFGRGLSFWTPSAQRAPPEPRTVVLGTATAPDQTTRKWLPENPTFASWRNAGLDCVDVLHWAANGKIAQLAGAEHPTVLHLHMSRVVLLSPYESIRKLVLSIASMAQVAIPGMPVPSREEGRDAEREVLQWAQRDEHKARLCALHCGCFLWHIRRYSTMAFYEPVSVFLATLTLWAYSSYASRASPRNARRNQDTGEQESRSGSASRRQTPEPGEHYRGNPQGGAGMGDSLPLQVAPSARMRESQVTIQASPGSALTMEDEPTFIRLDRPNDDEMVQLFVRSGRPSVMRAYITGVGDICSPKGPNRILREGRKILDAISISWGRTREYISILEAVEKATMNMSNASLAS